MAGSFQCAVLESPGKFRIQRRNLPDPGPRQIRVRLEGCGICGSNLPVWQGRPWFDYPRAPGSPGHEAWGIVEAHGTEARRFRIGDRVTLLSENAFAEVDVALEDHAVRLPAALDGMVFPGEAIGCAMNIFTRADIRPGQWVAIVGAGFLGAALTQLASRRGTKVIAISRRSHALDVARQMGAIHTLSMDERWRAVEGVKEITKGEFCPRVIEATGFQEPLDLASEICAEAGKLIIAGYHQDGLRQVNMQLWNWRGIDVINAHERSPARYIAGMEAAVKAVASGEFSPEVLYTHRYTLAGVNDALAMLDRREGDFMKAILHYE